MRGWGSEGRRTGGREGRRAGGQEGRRAGGHEGARAGGREDRRIRGQEDTRARGQEDARAGVRVWVCGGGERAPIGWHRQAQPKLEAFLMTTCGDRDSLPKASTFRDLLAWQASKQLALEVWRCCETPGMRRYHSLCDQLRRAAVSVPSNIAEGNERGTNLDALRFLQVARGSLAELETQLELSRDFGSLPAADYERISPLVVRVGRLLGGLIKARQARQNR